MTRALTQLRKSGCPAGCRTKIVRWGSYFRQDDRTRIPRYRCCGCKRCFSDATFDLWFRHKKRQFNLRIAISLVAGYSQRRLAFDLQLNRKTVVRKFRLYGKLAISALPIINRHKRISNMEFDDMESFIHTKCKPSSITIAVEYKTRRILGMRVSQMPAKGRLAKIARKKYGFRKDERPAARAELFSELKSIIEDHATIKSDQNPHYVPDVRRHFPNCTHLRFKGRRGCVVGQGELKRGGRDPIFTLNHTCAMVRANINRLFRKTWCTSKRIECLEMHIALYAVFHNLRLEWEARA
jgi:hypothetical protein